MKKISENEILEELVAKHNISNEQKFIDLYNQNANKSGNISKEKLDEIIQRCKNEKDYAIIEKKQSGLIDGTFKYVGQNFNFFRIKTTTKFDDEEIETEELWFKGKEIAEALGYKNSKEAIRDHVSEKYKMCLKDFFQRGEQNAPPFKKIKKDKKLDDFLKGGVYQTPPLKKIKNLQPNEIYISEPGLYSLVFSSQKAEAIAFREYVFEKVLPSLRKYGSFSINNTIKINTDTSFVKLFYKKPNLSDYNDYNVIYIGVLGMSNGGMLCKFGKCDGRIIDRCAEHKALYGSQFTIISVAITDNNTKSEKIFKKMIKDNKFNIELSVNGKAQTELFITNSEFRVETACTELERIAKENQSKVVEEVKQTIYYDDNTVRALEAQARIEEARAQARIEEAKAQQENSIARQKEADLETLKINKGLMVADKPKEEPKEEPKQIENNIIFVFLEQNTETSSRNHVHCVDLHNRYKDWSRNNYPNDQLLSNKSFANILRQYKELIDVKVNGKTKLGIKNLQFK
jgi:prophage antirepressor-like protein